MPNKRTLTLAILDGWGVAPAAPDNAISQADTPTWNRLLNEYKHTTLSGCGEDVGLPAGQMGNSEVGHVNIGAGRLVPQDIERISQCLSSDALFEQAAMTDLLGALKEDSAIHITGLISDGGVHSHLEQIRLILSMLRSKTSHPIYVHAILDGRDTPPQSAAGYLAQLDATLNALPDACIQSISGRYYAMDRDQRWERLAQFYDVMVKGEAITPYDNASHALRNAYERGETDEFVQPSIIGESHPICAQDIVLHLNFRADRARQLCYALTDQSFKHFPTAVYPRLFTLTEYDQNLNGMPIFGPTQPKNTLGEVLSDLGLSQLRLAETEKYAHVTFFFNGGLEAPFKNETRIMIPSPKVATYDLQPEMSASEVTDELIKAIESGDYDLIVVNYANADMVGHSGLLDAAIKAVQALDACLDRVVEAVTATSSQLLITADHGNVEKMFDQETNQPHTAHTLNPVPLVYVGYKSVEFRKKPGRLSDIAPTILSLMGVDIPTEMTGDILIEETPE